MAKKTCKRISLGIVCLILFLMIAACGAPKEEQTTTTAKSTETVKTTEAEKIKFSYMLPTKFVNWMKNYVWYNELLKRMNAEIELIPGGDGNDYTKNVDLRMTSGDLPDAIIVNVAQKEVYGSQGAFVDMKPLIDNSASNINKYLNDNPDLKMLLTTDGKIYGIPHENPLTTAVTFYREDMFNKAGITSVPRTIDELTEALVKLKETYKTTEYFYPLTGRDDVLKSFFTTPFKAESNVDSNGKVHGIYGEDIGGRNADIYSEGYKDLINWFRKLYAENLVDPEWITGAATEESWESKMLTGKAAMFNDNIGRGVLFTENGKKTDPNYAMKAMMPLLDKDGKQTILTGKHRFPNDRYFVINIKSENTDNIMKFLDYLYSEEGKTLASWGIENVTYKVEGGKKVFIVDPVTELNKPTGEINYGPYQDRLTFPHPCDNNAFYEFNDPTTKAVATEFFTKYAKWYPLFKYTPKQLEERSNLMAQVKEALGAYEVKFITGKLPMSEWDNFLKDMESKGYKRIVEIDQAAYDAINKK